jgi:hypothetical protein
VTEPVHNAWGNSGNVHTEITKADGCLALLNVGLRRVPATTDDNQFLHKVRSREISGRQSMLWSSLLFQCNCHTNCSLSELSQRAKWSSRIRPEKLTVAQVIKKFITIHETPFTTARHWSLSWATWIQSTFFQLISLTSILKLPSQMVSSLQVAFLILHACYMPRPSYSWSDHPNNIWWRVEIMKLHNVQVWSKYPPLYFVPEYPRSMFFPLCERPTLTPL